MERVRAGSRTARDDAAVPRDSALIAFQGVGYTYRSLLGRTVRAVEDFSLSIGESEDWTSQLPWLARVVVSKSVR